MKIRILTENIAGLGLGHVARCFNLGCTFLSMGYKVDFFVRGGADFSRFLDVQMSNIDAILHPNFYPLALQWEDIKNGDLLECDVCVIDSYHIGKEFLRLCLKHCVAVCVLDDDGRFIDIFKENIANLFILNQNGLYNLELLESSHIFSGLEYVLLNRCFLDVIRHDLQNLDSCGLDFVKLDSENSGVLRDSNDSKEKYDFFVCLGGEDKNDVSSKIFSHLIDSDFRVCVVLGANYEGRLLDSMQFKSMCHKPCPPHDCDDCVLDSKSIYTSLPLKVKSDIFFNISQSQVARLIRESKACIVSGGGIIFEALSVNENVFVINLANNQDKQIEILLSQDLIKEIKYDSKDFRDLQNLDSILDSMKHKGHKKHKKDVKVGTKAIDFAGTLCMFAINDALLRKKKFKDFRIEINTDSKIILNALDFCNLGSQESLRVLNYRNHPFVNKNMYGSPHISVEAHFSFLSALRNDALNKYFLIQESHKDIGVINLTRINLKHKHSYLGIYKNPFLGSHVDSNVNFISPLSKGHDMSYGEKLMYALKHIAFKEYRLCMLYLEVLDSNTRAIRLYEKIGFRYCGRLKKCFISHDSKEPKDILVYELENTASNKK